jgi:hypothetical protein
MTLSGTPPPKPCGFGGLGATFFGFKISAIISLYVIFFFFFFVLGILYALDKNTRRKGYTVEKNVQVHIFSEL